ncbi:MAG: hypothetical protein H7X71_03065, partial [Chitinophagales bacterium]|nr:hypothetical protein [Chitinophagales bacterium]
MEDDSLKAVDYYPLSVGKYLIYNVDSIIYNETIADDTTNWQIKEELIDTFYDAEQRLNFVLERSRRLSDTLSWQTEYVWSVLDNNGNIEKTENNLKFIRLISPVRL